MVREQGQQGQLLREGVKDDSRVYSLGESEDGGVTKQNKRWREFASAADDNGSHGGLWWGHPGGQ